MLQKGERNTCSSIYDITIRNYTKVGNQEFPEIMNRTPGVYATKQGGGYGDSRISLEDSTKETHLS